MVAKNTRRPNYSITASGEIQGAIGQLERLVISDQVDALRSSSEYWISRYPKEGSFWYMYGLSYFLRKDMLRSVGQFSKAHRYGYENAQFLDHYGISLFYLGRFRKARAILKKSLKIDPDRVSSLINLAKVEYRLRAYAEAIRLAGRSLELRPGLKEAKVTLFKCLANQGELDEGVKLLRDMLVADPYDLEVVSVGAEKLRAAGDIHHSMCLYRQMLKLDPGNFEARLRIFTWEKDRESCIAMEREMVPTIVDQSVQWRERRRAAFSLGRALVMVGEDERGFRTYLRANEIVRENMDPPLDMSPMLKHYRKSLDRDWFQQRIRAGSPTKDEIFIVGFSRSGKSLVERVIGCGHGVLMRGESKEFYDFVRKEINGLKDDVPRLDSFLRLRGRAIESLAKRYDAMMPHDGYRRTTTTPANMYFLMCLGVLCPQVPIILCRRDLLDLGLACFFKDYEHGFSFSNDLFSLGREIRIFDELIGFWCQVLPNPVLVVRYEDLVQDTKRETAKIYQFLGMGSHRDYLNCSQSGEDSVRWLGLDETLDATTRLRADFVGSGEAFRPYLGKLVEGYHSVESE